MLNNANSNNCGYADEILSYIYDEIGGAERLEFETHLAGCTPCTDEFAEISHARFSVFEWRKEEFAHLSTPDIVIPYIAKARVVEENESVGFLAGLRGLLGIASWPVAVAASLLICLGIGFVAMNYFDNSGEQIAANVNVPVVASPIVNSVPVQNPPTITKVEDPEIRVTNSPKVVTTPHEIRPIKVVEIRQPRTDRHMTAETQRPYNNISQPNREAPVLNNYDDSDDKSLRLSDLFDEEVGSIR